MVTTRRTLRAAGMMLLILSGCAGSDYFSLSYWQRDSSGQTSGLGITRTGGATNVTLRGNPDVATQRFRHALAQLGMTAKVENDAAGVRITATTKTGKSLTVALKRSADAGGEMTIVDVQWVGEADKDVETNLIRLVLGAGER